MSSASASRPRCWASEAVNNSPAFATAWSSSKVTARRSRVCDDGIEKVPLLLGKFGVSATPISLQRRHFSRMRDLNRPRSHLHHRWIEAKRAKIEAEALEAGPGGRPPL